MKKQFKPWALMMLVLPLSACGTSALPSSSPSVSSASTSDSSSAVSSDVSSSSTPISSSSSSQPKVTPTYDAPSLSIHYQRTDKAYGNWALWLWETGFQGSQFEFNGSDDFGAVAAYPLSRWSDGLLTNGLGFIVKEENSWTKDVSDDRLINFSLLKEDAHQIYNVYLFTGDPTIYDSPSKTQADAILNAGFVSDSQVSISATNAVSSYTLFEDDAVLKTDSLATPAKAFTIDFPTGTVGDVAKAYSVSVTFEASSKSLSHAISSYILYKQDAFTNAYTYSGDDLGATVSGGKTTFKVWSPVSSSIVLNIYGKGTPVSVSSSLGDDTKTTYPMVKGSQGVWSYVYDGDLSGKYYTYFVTNHTYPEGVEIVDPYAKSCGINGLRGMVVDFSLTDPTGWDDFTMAHSIDRKSLCVDEMHIADLTSDSTWGGTATNAKKYAGFFEGGTSYTQNGASYKTGFDHIQELGVNAVQLQPVFDQANDETKPVFNWGYNPLNYNCLEGSYSSDPYDGYARIKEFKALVMAYWKAGINIIMDVVYNHVDSVTKSNFDVLCPGYFFRYTASGALYNGSGCGDDTASEMPMMRKFMLDSTSFWEKEYKLGGFRFDLMGLHDLTTMNAIAAACKAINPTFCIYGEPWNLSTGLAPKDQASQNNGDKWVGYGGFNDQLRDSLIAGGLHNKADRGWASATVMTSQDALITKGIKGATNFLIDDPDKTVNYVTCHDNYTLYDRFFYGNEIVDETLVKKMAVLAESVALLSQGTSFFQGGEEFLRTKGGESNSYQSDYPVNAFHYDLKAKNADVFAFFRKLIALKTTSGFFSLGKADVASKMTASFNASGNTLAYSVELSSGKKIKVAVANDVGTPDPIDFSGYDTSLDSLGKTLGASYALSPLEVAVGTSGI